MAPPSHETGASVRTSAFAHIEDTNAAGGLPPVLKNSLEQNVQNAIHRELLRKLDVVISVRHCQLAILVGSLPVLLLRDNDTVELLRVMSQPPLPSLDVRTRQLAIFWEDTLRGWSTPTRQLARDSKQTRLISILSCLWFPRKALHLYNRIVHHGGPDSSREFPLNSLGDSNLSCEPLSLPLMNNSHSISTIPPCWKHERQESITQFTHRTRPL